MIACTSARAAHADDVISAGPLALRTRGDLVLGTDTDAVVHVHTGAARLVSNAGTIDALVADGSEQRATLHLPSERYPQLAIIAALDADDRVLDWLAVPLAGQAKVKIQTEPNASVIVRIAGHDLGPFVADRAGIASVPIIVPPGVHGVTTVATSTTGNTTERPVSLGVRPFARALVSCSDRTQRVSVVAVTSDATPSREPPSLTITSGGSSALIAARVAGVYEATITADGDFATVSAAFASEEVAATTCALALPPETPSDGKLAVERERFVAGSGPLALHVELAFPGKRRAIETNVILTADLGTIAAATRDGATWTLPDAFADRREAHARLAVTWRGGHLEREVVIAMIPSEPIRIEATAPPMVRADGTESGDIVARVVDRFGNAVATTGLRARGRGRIGEFVVRPDRSLIARYVSPRARVAGDDAIDLDDRTSGLATRIVVPLDPLPKQVVVSARVGYLSNFGRISAPLFAVAGEARLPLLHERLVLGGELGLYRGTFTAMSTDPIEDVRATVLATPILARVAYRAPIGGAELWGGLGIGTEIAAISVQSPSAGKTSSTTLHVAASVFGGGAMRFPWGLILVEAQYLHATLASGPLQGRLGGFAISAGYAHEL